MSRQASASNTALLLACPRPFDPDNDDEGEIPGEPARYGSAFHQVIAACLRASMKKRGAALLEKADPGRYAKEVDKAAVAYDVRKSAAELAGHVKSSLGVLRNWLTRENLEVVEVETAYAITPNAFGGPWHARLIKPHDESHHYDVEESEVPGTVDLIAATANLRRGVVIDHKTGGGESDTFAQPAKIPQMRTLGLVLNRPEEIEVGIFHADRRGLPAMYSEPYERAARHAHAKELGRALTLVGSGFLRPGPHCGRCPIRLTCPAHRADLLAESTVALMRAGNAVGAEPLVVGPNVSKLPIETRAGMLYELLKKFGALEKVGREEIRRLVREGAIVETSDGKTLEIREQTYETLSKKSVLEALGEKEGEKMLKKLRAKGAIRETKREMMIPVK